MSNKTQHNLEKKKHTFTKNGYILYYKMRYRIIETWSMFTCTSK